LAATNRWLTAADANVARCPTKLAFCSRFRRQRKVLHHRETPFSLASIWAPTTPATPKFAGSRKRKKADGGKPPASPSRKTLNVT
jgi:hypothetical protein